MVSKIVGGVPRLRINDQPSRPWWSPCTLNSTLWSPCARRSTSIATFFECRPERLETFVNFQCETVSDSESARALSESARVRPQRLDTPDHPPPAPDKRCSWLRCVPTFWDASSRSCTEDAYIYTSGTNNRPHPKHLSRKLQNAYIVPTIHSPLPIQQMLLRPQHKSWQHTASSLNSR